MSIAGKGARLHSIWSSLRAARPALRWGDRDALDAGVWTHWAFESAAAPITGTLASTQAANTTAVLGAAALEAAAAALQTVGTAAATGAVVVTGSAAAIQAPGTASASDGAIPDAGNAAILARLEALEAQIANLGRNNIYVGGPSYDSITRRHPSIEERERKKARIQKNNEQVLALIGAFLGDQGARRHEGPMP